MATVKKKTDFLTSEDGQWCRKTLEAMELDKGYHTESSFTIDVIKFPDHEMPFVTTHLTYLAKHSEVNPKHYISNLRIRLRKI